MRGWLLRVEEAVVHVAPGEMAGNDHTNLPNIFRGERVVGERITRVRGKERIN